MSNRNLMLLALGAVAAGVVVYVVRRRSSTAAHDPNATAAHGLTTTSRAIAGARDLVPA